MWAARFKTQADHMIIDTPGICPAFFISGWSVRSLLLQAKVGIKKRACQGRRINYHVRSPVAQGQGMRSPADEHHPNRITSSKMLKINTVFRRKLIYVQRNPLKKKRCVVLFCIKLHQVAPLRLQTHLQAMATTKLYLDTRANALGTPAPVKISLCLNGKTVLYSTGVWKSGSTWPPVSENKVPPESGNKSVPYIRRSLSSDSPVKR